MNVKLISYTQVPIENKNSLNLFIFLNEDYVYLFTNLQDISYLNTYIDYSKILKYENHLEVLGKSLFKEYIISFLLCGFILFISLLVFYTPDGYRMLISFYPFVFLLIYDNFKKLNFVNKNLFMTKTFTILILIILVL